MERIKRAFIGGGLIGLKALCLYILIGGVWHLIDPSFTMSQVADGALGTGIFVGLVCGIMEAYYENRLY